MESVPYSDALSTAAVVVHPSEATSSVVEIASIISFGEDLCCALATLWVVAEKWVGWWILHRILHQGGSHGDVCNQNILFCNGAGV